MLDDGLAVVDDDHIHDVVFSGGRVIDPDSHFDAVAHVGIDGDSITRISLEPLTGTTTVDAAGLVVSPGFIDILSYRPNGYGEWFKVADGVTALVVPGLTKTDAGPGEASPGEGTATGFAPLPGGGGLLTLGGTF